VLGLRKTLGRPPDDLGDALTAVCALASTPIAVSRPSPEGPQRSVGVARRDVSTLLAEGLQAVRLCTTSQAVHRDADDMGDRLSRTPDQPT
jgi:hypothetical protein